MNGKKAKKLRATANIVCLTSDKDIPIQSTYGVIQHPIKINHVVTDLNGQSSIDEKVVIRGQNLLANCARRIYQKLKKDDFNAS